MQSRRLGRTGLAVSPIGFGAFKIGRNEQIKYAESYRLPNECEVERFLNALLDLGVTCIDTAPAYGISEERIGSALWRRRGEFLFSTKVGETFQEGRSVYDFSRAAIRASIRRSLGRLRTDVLDLVFLHSDGDDLRLLNETDAVATLRDLKAAGAIRGIGLSATTVEGARQALEWADVLMLEYHPDNRSMEPIVTEAAERGVGVIVKKGLASGRLPADQAIRFILGNANVSSMVVGSLSLEHMQANIAAAGQVETGVAG